MKHGSTTTHLKQKGRQLSGQHLVKAVQSDQKLNSGQTRLWHPYFGALMVFYLSNILGTVKPLTASIIWTVLSGSFERRNQEETAPNAKEKSVVPPRQCTVPQVHENDGQIQCIKLRIASSPTIFSRSGPQ